MLTAEIDVVGERLLMSPYKALYWPRKRWLLVSDAHLGKAAHFQKAGLPLPDVHDDVLLDRLSWLMNEFGAERLVVLGDLSTVHTIAAGTSSPFGCSGNASRSTWCWGTMTCWATAGTWMLD